MTLAELLRASPTRRVAGSVDIPISGLRHDSREVVPGDLFFAMPGAKTDGNRHARQALDNGAVAVVSELEPPPPPAVMKGTWIQVEDIALAMAPHLARDADHHPHLEVPRGAHDLDHQVGADVSRTVVNPPQIPASYEQAPRRIAHAELRPPEAAQHFDCILGTRLADKPRPALTRLMLPFLTFVALAAACMGMLNSLHRFFIPALSPAELVIRTQSLINMGYCLNMYKPPPKVALLAMNVQRWIRLVPWPKYAPPPRVAEKLFEKTQSSRAP